VVLDVVAVAAAVPFLYDVAGFGEINDDPVGGALGDVERCCDVPKTAWGSLAMNSNARAWLVRKLQSPVTVRW
jgi:hypothetical protein